jgi:subfamily B ATP-binding cassette protein MsbA
MERVYALLDIPPQEVDPPDAKALEPIRENLHIQVQRFAYEGVAEPALHEIDLEVKAGQVVALVGPSGAGKTTLVNLIPRFFELKEGAIRIDGMDTRQGTLASLRGQIAIVTQEIFLFNDTVANNIAYGNIDCPREVVIAAAKAAYADRFISELPLGYDTLVGEGGIHLSGGQRQRISIARALIKNAPILVLDEATSALDSESEQEVQKAIAALIQNRTTIVIAHRLSTIRAADLICVLDKGRIAERGGHDELMRRGGLYKKLHDMQFRDMGGAAPAGRFPWRRLMGRGKSDEIKRATGPGSL